MIENIVQQWAEQRGYPAEAVRKYGTDEPRLVLVGEDHCFEQFGNSNGRWNDNDRKYESNSIVRNRGRQPLPLCSFPLASS